MGTKLLETDVLVIGGGLAGCFAAVRARQLGAEVVLVDKNTTGRSGCSVYAGGMLVFSPQWGDELDAWLEQFSRVGEYLVDRKWVEIMLKESYARHRDMVSWGIPFYKKDGTVGFPQPGEEPSRPLWLKSKYRSTCRLSEFGAKDKMLKARQKVVESKCTVLDRVMITDLLEKDGWILGAVGFHVRTGDFYVIKSKATAIASGMLSFKGAGYGRQFNTGDGTMMGYRAGAELKSMEWGGIMYVVSKCDTVIIDGPTWETGGKDDVTNARGEFFLGDEGNPGAVTLVLWPIEIHAGRGPIFHEPYGVDREQFKDEIRKYEEKSEGPWITMLDRAGLDIFKDRLEQHTAFVGARPGGGLRINEKCETSLPGLYAAGDASGCGLGGANYPSGGTGMMKAAVSGYRAGQGAAHFALKTEMMPLEKSVVAAYEDITFAPLRRESGFSTDHVLMRVQQTIFPYEVHMVMHEKRLQSALTMVEFFKDHFLPKLRAVDLHDLRKAHEVRNIVLGAEILIRTSLTRTESRGCFYREDYPHRDDENWLKWILVRDEGGKMKIWTEFVPKDSWGDTSMPYDLRYPLKYER
ncbi:MAG: FAD-binding protein [Deltaproteobacteria bacterium]|nr:FAD-binding protein [Deltaproteobacteria bacterium]